MFEIPVGKFLLAAEPVRPIFQRGHEQGPIAQGCRNQETHMADGIQRIGLDESSKESFFSVGKGHILFRAFLSNRELLRVVPWIRQIGLRLIRSEQPVRSGVSSLETRIEFQVCSKKNKCGVG